LNEPHDLGWKTKVPTAVSALPKNPAVSTLDRVRDRRRPVALAQHYGDPKGLSIAEIAQRLGRSPATVKAYFYDPYR
jgi:DNA-binding NarL/FixJ family response regulator